MKRLLYIWLFVLSALSAVAQERKDSIQILFPDSASTTLQLDYLNTSQIVDSIIASLALPQNAQRPIFLSTVTPPQGVVSFYNGRDSIALERLQTVALLLSDHGIADSLICYNIETYDSLNVADTLQSATFSAQSEGVWLHMPGGEWLGTGTYDISPLAQQAPDSVAADSVVVSAHRKAKSPKTTVSRPACSIQKSRPSFRSSFRSSSTPTPLTSHPQKAKDNTFINNARTMDSLTNLVRLLQDTIAQYRQQIADLRQIQYQAQIANTQTDGFNHTLYVVLVVLLVICLLLLLYFIYERRRTKEEMEALKEEVIYNMMSLQHVATQHVDNQQISTPPPSKVLLVIQPSTRQRQQRLHHHLLRLLLHQRRHRRHRRPSRASTEARRFTSLWLQEHARLLTSGAVSMSVTSSNIIASTIASLWMAWRPTITVSRATIRCSSSCLIWVRTTARYSN